MKRLSYILIAAAFILCSAQTCMKEEAPQPVTPTRITVSTGSTNIVYPFPYSTPGTVNISVSKAKSEDAIEVSATADGMNVSIDRTEFSDRIDCTISLEAKEDMGDNPKLRIIARNPAESVEKEITLEKAYITIAKSVFDNISTDGGGYDLGIESNVPVELEILENPDGMILAAGPENTTKRLTAILDANITMDVRTAKLKIVEKAGIFNDTEIVMNQLGRSIPYVLNEATDRQALKIIDEVLQISEVSGFAQYYDIPLEEWPWTCQGGNLISNGRIVTLRTQSLDDYQLNCIGLATTTAKPCYIPVEIGWLDKMRELSFDGEMIQGKVPESIKNCTSLSQISLSRTKIEEKLEDSNIKFIAHQLKQFDLSKYHYGPVPEWLSRTKDKSVTNWITHLSGKIPDNVVNKFHNVDQLILFTRNYYNYALWTGNQPTNVKWVNDEHDGHWEWTDTIYDEMRFCSSSPSGPKCFMRYS